MNKPNLNCMWETFVELSFSDILSGKHITIIKEKIYPLISSLESEGIINWYCLLIHDKDSGVPATENNGDPYFHIRFALVKDLNPNTILPEYCVLTRKIEYSWVEKICGIDSNLLKNEDIAEAWRIIGEQTEWLFRMLNIFKGDVPLQTVGQFLHFYANVTQLRIA